jgi:hypothetical protein
MILVPLAVSPLRTSTTVCWRASARPLRFDDAARAEPSIEKFIPVLHDQRA